MEELIKNQPAFKTDESKQDFVKLNLNYLLFNVNLLVPGNLSETKISMENKNFENYVTLYQLVEKLF